MKRNNKKHPLFTYCGYCITKSRYDLNDIEDHALGACYFMVSEKLTIRETAKYWDYSATTFWRRIHNECKELSPELYEAVVAQMRKNMQRRRG